VRSYAYVLLRWWRCLLVVDVSWDRATSAEVRDLVLWLARTVKPNQDGGVPAAPVISPIADCFVTQHDGSRRPGSPACIVMPGTVMFGTP
jgi:integrase/recombinase XerD